MYRALSLLLVSITFTGTIAAGDLADHSFFSELRGEWVGEGSMTDAEGETTEVREEWTGRPTEEGGFILEGERRWGEEEQEFRWEFTFDSIIEFYRCEYWQTGMEEPLRFDMSLGEDSLELHAHPGDSGGELRVHNTLTAEGLGGEVSWRNGDGVEMLSGTLNHRRRGSTSSDE